MAILVHSTFYNQKILIFFSFLHENICCGYSLEVPQQGVSNEYPYDTFSWRNKKNIIWIPPLIWGYVGIMCFVMAHLDLAKGMQ